jgi:general secretion pathway protein D
LGARTTRLIAAVAALALAVSGCTTYKPAIPPSEGHLTQESVAPPEDRANILPPVTNSTYVPPPRPKVKPTTYSVVVHEVPVKELLLALARDTKENIDIHPGLAGLVSLNAIDETLPSILDRISKQVNMRYRVDGRTIVVGPDAPYIKTYKVDYVNMLRDTQSTISVSGQISEGGGGGIQVNAAGASETSVKSTSKNNFWDLINENIKAILSSTRTLAQGAQDRQARAEAQRAAREERIAQAEAVARAGPNAEKLFDKAFGPQSRGASDPEVNEIIVNPVAGTVTVLATDRQHQLIQAYLDGVLANSQRQVLIECTIAEVLLSHTYQLGIDWQKLVRAGAGFNIQAQLLGGALGSTAPQKFIIGYGTPDSDVYAALKALETFGNTRVLSSPKLMALNNQTALLKVVDNVVYFTIQSSISQGTATSSNLQSVTTTPNTVAVGVVLSMTPQINQNGSVTITVRPTISKIQSFVNDPNPVLTTAPDGTPLSNPIQNQVPQISVREMESVLQLVSGQTAVMGGLIQDTVQRDRTQIPYAGSLPKVGDVFAFRDENVQKSELVIFLRPIIVTNPSLDSEELKHLRKLLPEVDETGQNP